MNIHQLLITTAVIGSLALPTVVLAEEGATDSAPASASSASQQKGDIKGAPEMDWKTIRKHRDEVLAQLPPEKSKLYRETMKKAYEEKNDIVREQIHKVQDESDALLTAAKFDKAAFLAKNAELDKLHAESRTNLNQAFASVAEQCSQDERKILAKLRPERKQSPAKMDAKDKKDVQDNKSEGK
jgi:uncharacterized membrane protein